MLNNSKQLTYIIKKIINENYKRILLKEEGEDAGLPLPGQPQNTVEVEGQEENPQTPLESNIDLLDQGVGSPDGGTTENTTDQNVHKVSIQDTSSQPKQPTNQPLNDTTDTTESITSLKLRFFATNKSNKNAQLVNLNPGQMKIEFRQPTQSTAAGQGQTANYAITTQPNVNLGQIIKQPTNRINN